MFRSYSRKSLLWSRVQRSRGLRAQCIGWVGCELRILACLPPGTFVIVTAASTLALAMLLIRRRAILAGVGIAALVFSGFLVCAGPVLPQVQTGGRGGSTHGVNQGRSTILI